jgi:hypothetical protein
MVDLLTQDGVHLDADEERFRYVQTGAAEFDGPMGNMPTLWGPPDTIVHDWLTDVNRPTPDCSAAGGGPVVLWAPLGTVDMSHLETKADLYVDVLLKNGSISSSDDVACLIMFLLSFFNGHMNLSFIPEADLEQLYVTRLQSHGEGFLSGGELHLLHLWWAAVHLGVDVAGWYSWSLADDEAAAQILLAPPTVDTAAASGLRPYHALTHRSTVYALAPADKTGGWNPHLMFCNPTVAAYFARAEVCRYAQPSQPLDAVDLIVDWIHGPENVYCTCDSLLKAVAHPEGWCWLHKQPSPGSVGFGMDLAMWTLVSAGGEALAQDKCAYDGSQAWVHGTRCNIIDPSCLPNYKGHFGPWSLSGWYNDRIVPLVEAPDGVRVHTSPGEPGLGFVIRAKRQGCGPTSWLLAACAAAMNVPAVWGLVPIGSGGFIHTTVLLPLHGLAISHGDHLWGPGASVFPARDLWVDHNVALATAYFRREVFEQFGAYGSGSTYGRMQEIVYAAARYVTARQYFRAMLQSARNPRYRQVLLDAILFKAQELTQINFLGIGEPVAFSAIREWSNHANPIHPANVANYTETSTLGGWAFSAVSRVPELLGDDWPASAQCWPVTCWNEPSIQARALEAASYFNLNSLGYTLPPDLLAWAVLPCQ